MENKVCRLYSREGLDRFTDHTYVGGIWYIDCCVSMLIDIVVRNQTPDICVLDLGFRIRCRASGDILRNLGAVELMGIRGTYERIVKLGYGLNILGTVPLVILPMQSILVPMMNTCMHNLEAKRCSTALEKRLISAGVIGTGLMLAAL